MVTPRKKYKSKRKPEEYPGPDAEAIIPSEAEETESIGSRPWYESPFKRLKVHALLAEIARRRAEALVLYEPLQIANEFHACTASERVVRGSNRAGKTLSVCVEIARAVTGQDPFKKYPLTDGRCFLVGKDGKHLGEVLYRKLFRAGAFTMIRDEETQLWRAYRPATDWRRKREAKPAPPLIPPRFIKSISWENKKSNIPDIVTLVNGWEIKFFSSLGKPPQGSDIDLGVFDEEVVDTEWYPEVSARLLDRMGKFIWGACPQAATEHLYALHERAEKEENDPLSKIREFLMLLDDNPHIDADQKKEFKEKLSEEERKVRYYGEYARTSFRVYPEFSDYIHGIDFFVIPADWTRYMVVDPGRQVCAVLFAAVPPDNKHVYLYDELYIKECDAKRFGREVAAKSDNVVYEDWIIDTHAGRITEMGSGRNIEQQFAEALRENNVRCKRGYSFSWGSDDIQAGIMAVRSWLIVRADGTPKLKVLRDRCPNWRWEMGRYHYKRNAKGELLDVPENRHDHEMDDTRYLAMYDPKWVRPPVAQKPENYAVRAMRLKRERARQKEGGGSIRFGPGGA